jgi:hypothetical protein
VPYKKETTQIFAQAPVTALFEGDSAADARVESMTTTNFPLVTFSFRGKFVAVMDSTRASAALAGSSLNVTRAVPVEPSPSVTRLFLQHMKRGINLASTSTRNLVDRSHMLFQAAHDYMSPIFRSTPPYDETEPEPSLGTV